MGVRLIGGVRVLQHGRSEGLAEIGDRVVETRKTDEDRRIGGFESARTVAADDWTVA